MFDPKSYELIDFGDGTKVERFGGKLIARESPSVDLFAMQSEIENYEVDASYDRREKGPSKWHGQLEDGWEFMHGSVRFSLRQAPSGQVGVFPEQAHNWDWIAKHAERIAGKRAINLFAYTGGTTLALAAAGAEVTHVDSASSVVTWARENASLSGLSDRPVRWIVEDAMRFVQREIKRGKTYDIFVADPPSFGRGVKKETWKIDRDIDELFKLAAELCPQPTMAIVSCHTPTLDSSELAATMNDFFAIDSAKVEAIELMLQTSDGRELPSGECARFVAGA